METGRCNYIDEQGNACCAVSYEDENGTVTTDIKYEEVKIEE